MAGLGSRINRLIGIAAPRLALRRETALAQLGMLQAQAGSYDGAGRGHRGKDFRFNRADAREASRPDRDRLTWIGRDMLRNNPRVVKIRRSLVNQVVGAGIRPAIRWKGRVSKATKDRVQDLVEAHCLSVDFDADGVRSMLGMQGTGFGSTVVDGEILFRRRLRRPADGYGLNFQVQMLEGDFLNRDIDGDLGGGRFAVEGVEFDARGKRVAYHLFDQHPGGRVQLPQTRRVSAENIIHLFEPLRPGQVRGVTWLAPVITLLHDLHGYQDAQVKRQEVAAMFAGVLKSGETADSIQAELGTLTSGGLLTIASDEEMQFTDPPATDGYDSFMRVTERAIAAGMGITYEALTGDYSNVNYTSGRMGRMDVDPNIRDWQDNLMIAVACQGFARWIQEAVEDVTDVSPADWSLEWTPPVRPVIDPTKDYRANEVAMQSGQKSRRQVIRESGQDPARIEAEIIEERKWEADNDVALTSNKASATPAAPAAPAPNPGGEGGAGGRDAPDENGETDDNT